MPNNTTPKLPALEQVLQESFAGRYYVQTSQLSLGTSGQLVVNHNFERLALAFSNTGTYPAYLLPASNVSTTNGFLIGANGGFLSLNSHDDLILVGWEWYGIGLGGATTIVVLEIIRYSG